jgi:hypothetical protein
MLATGVEDLCSDEMPIAPQLWRRPIRPAITFICHHRRAKISLFEMKIEYNRYSAHRTMRVSRSGLMQNVLGSSCQRATFFIESARFSGDIDVVTTEEN